jgi:signal peptide peptidase SppA
MRNLIKDIKANRPLLIQPEQANAYLERTAKVDLPLGAKLSDFSDMLSAMFGEPATLEVFPPFAIVPVKGVISKNVSELDALCGACDIEHVEEMLEAAERDASVTTVILVIDSPGGTSVGVPELAARIRGYSKDVLAFTDNEACSAAYWLGSQARAFYATPSATVGSIGCYIAYPDCSKAYEMEGVKMEVIKSGAFKGAGIAGTSLDDGQRAMLQKEVEEIHADFKADVKAVREFADDASMEGQTFSGKNAAEAGLVTGLVNGFDELMESLNAEVAKQMEADERNDAAAEGEAGEAEETAKAKAFRSASARALAGVNLKPSAKASKMEEGEDDEDEEEGEDAPESEDDQDEKKPESEDEEDDKEKKSEDDQERAEDEEGAGDDAVDTDEKPDKSGVKRNRSKGIA